MTAEDFEELAREVAPDAARVHCVTADDPADAGGVRVLVVPHVAGDEVGRIRREDLIPPEGTLERISRRAGRAPAGRDPAAGRAAGRTSA